MGKRTKRGPHRGEAAPKSSGSAPLRPAPPVIKAARSLSPEEAEVAKIHSARKMAMIGFSICGVVLGLLAGINHWTEAPATVISGSFGDTVWLGAALGELQLDWVRAIMTGALGLLVGLTLGATVGFRSPRMLACWVLGGVALAIGMVSTHNPAIGAIGWLLGITLALRAPVG